MAQRRLSGTEVGATAGTLPPGYDHLVRSRRVGAGEAVFREAPGRLMGRDVHRSAGIHVLPTVPRVPVGARVLLRVQEQMTRRYLRAL